MVLMMDEESLGEMEDMVNFNDLSEGPLLHNLRKRFLGDKIYTYAYHARTLPLMHLLLTTITTTKHTNTFLKSISRETHTSP